MNTYKTYIAFDVLGMRDQVHSNYHTFETMDEWERAHPDRFHFLNLSERDRSIRYEDVIDSTLKRYYLSLMAQADNLLIVASPVLNVDSEMLNWQISRAVNQYRLPVIVAFAGLDHVDDDTLTAFYAWLPAKVKKYMGLKSARMCYLPLTKDKLERALRTFSVHDNVYPWDSTTIF